MPPDITVKEAQVAKRALEAALLETIQTFERNTGLVVANVFNDRVRQLGVPGTIEVVVEVRL